MLLRQSNVNTNILLYAHLYGNHEYSAIPFFPIGMEDLIHENPIRRKIWDEHAMKGWVLGTSDKHYRCWRLWIKRTRATIISGMVFFKHKYILNPTVTAAEAVLAAAQDMAAVLRKKTGPPPRRRSTHCPRQPATHIRQGSGTEENHRRTNPTCIPTKVNLPNSTQTGKVDCCV